MDLNWIWLAGLIVAIVFFAVVEGYALKHPTRLNTCHTASHTSVPTGRCPYGSVVFSLAGLQCIFSGTTAHLSGLTT